MGAADSSHRQLDVSKLSDADLVDSHCAGSVGDDVISELWIRHEKRALGIVHRLVSPTRFCPHGWSPQAFEESAFSRAQRYGVSTTPTLVFIDRNGIVRRYHSGQLTEAALDREFAWLVR